MRPPHHLGTQEVRQRGRILERRLPRLFQQAGLFRLQLLRQDGRARRQQSEDREVFARGHGPQSIGLCLENDGSIRRSRPAVARSPGGQTEVQPANSKGGNWWQSPLCGRGPPSPRRLSTRSARLKERFTMCLAIPGKVLETADSGWNRVGKVQFGGVTREVYLDFVPEAGVGDYVLVHVGFAVAKVDEAEAKRTYELLEQMGALEEEPTPPPSEQ